VVKALSLFGKDTMTKILALLLSFSSTAFADTSAAKLLVGTYTLTKVHMGECHEKIDIEFNEYPNREWNASNMLGIYGHPRGSGKVVAQLVDVNLGERTQVSENPMSGEKKWRKEVAYVIKSEKGIYIMEQEGEYVHFAPNLDSGEFLYGQLSGDELVVSSGTFSSSTFTNGSEGQIFTSKVACSYKPE
jgi:hypothetical protein